MSSFGFMSRPTAHTVKVPSVPLSALKLFGLSRMPGITSKAESAGTRSVIFPSPIPFANRQGLDKRMIQIKSSEPSVAIVLQWPGYDTDGIACELVSQAAEGGMYRVSDISAVIQHLMMEVIDEIETSNLRISRGYEHWRLDDGHIHPAALLITGLHRVSCFGNVYWPEFELVIHTDDSDWSTSESESE